MTENKEVMQQGSCLCGKASYTIAGTFDAFYFCHCKYCQKDTGTAHGANLFANGAKLTWLSGDKLITLFNLPDTRHTKCFCSCCGSALPFKQGDMVVVPAGSLDSDLDITATAHLFCTSRAQWEDQLSVVKRYDKYPAA